MHPGTTIHRANFLSLRCPTFENLLSRTTRNADHAMRALLRLRPRQVATMVREDCFAFLSRFGASPLTIVFLAMNVSVHYVAVGLGGEEALNSLYDTSGQDIDRLVHGEWWRLITSAWVHLQANHLISNMRFLVCSGCCSNPPSGRDGSRPCTGLRYSVHP